MGSVVTRRLTRTLVCLMFAAVPAAAQEVRSSRAALAGMVSDTSGAALPGATIEAVANDRSIADTVSGPDGRYRLEVPARVPVKLQVRLTGFAEYAVDVAGSTGEVTRDVTLQIGRLSDTIVVTAARGAESRANVTASVTVATREDLQAIGAH